VQRFPEKQPSASQASLEVSFEAGLPLAEQVMPKGCGSLNASLCLGYQDYAATTEMDAFPWSAFSAAEALLGAYLQVG
jgi:hypothetical protein